VSRKNVLFLCIGNACRSQMAEGFARVYGGDVMVPSSAGLAPAGAIPPLTLQVMKEKNISLDNHFPKDLGVVRSVPFDLIVNMTGQKLAANVTVPVEDWSVRDPIGQDESVYRATRDVIENRVMQLVLAMRTGRI